MPSDRRIGNGITNGASSGLILEHVNAFLRDFGPGFALLVVLIWLAGIGSKSMRHFETGVAKRYTLQSDLLPG